MFWCTSVTFMLSSTIKVERWIWMACEGQMFVYDSDVKMLCDKEYKH